MELAGRRSLVGPLVACLLAATFVAMRHPGTAFRGPASAARPASRASAHPRSGGANAPDEASLSRLGTFAVLCTTATLAAAGRRGAAGHHRVTMYRGNRAERAYFKETTGNGVGGHDWMDNFKDWKDWIKKTRSYGYPEVNPKNRRFYPGTRGMSFKMTKQTVLPDPNRQAFGKVEEAMLIFRGKAFDKSPPAELSADAVKEVGSCSGPRKGPMTVPAKVGNLHMPQGERLEQEMGAKRRPEGEEEYVKYVDKMCNIEKMTTEVAEKLGVTLDHDFICDVSSLMLLLRWFSGKLSLFLNLYGQKKNPIDLLIIRKNPNGKGLMMDDVYEHKNMVAQRRGYQGAYMRSEAPQHGSYMPAFERAASGDRTMSVSYKTGLTKYASSREGGLPDRAYRFSEYEMGGLKFLTRARTNVVKKDGEDVSLKLKNWYHQGKVKAADIYMQMVLGGISNILYGFHRMDFIQTAHLTHPKKILKKLPGVKEAADRRFGKVADLLKQVKEAVDSSKSEGPWVLQWQGGRLVLGEYPKEATWVQKAEWKPAQEPPEDLYTNLRVFNQNIARFSNPMFDK